MIAGRPPSVSNRHSLYIAIKLAKFVALIVVNADIIRRLLRPSPPA